MNVMIESPMALKKEDGEKIMYKALNVSKEVFVARPNRFVPSCVWLKGLLDREYLGNIMLVQANVFLSKDLSHYGKNLWRGTKNMDGGTIFSQVNPFIDTIYWMFGDIVNIKTNFKDYLHRNITDFEDTGVIQFDLVTGGIGSINFTTAVWDKDIEGSLTVLAERGSVKLSGMMMEKVDYAHIKDYTSPLLNKTHAKEYIFCRSDIIQNAIDSLKRRIPPANHALEGTKIVEMIRKIYE